MDLMALRTRQMAFDCGRLTCVDNSAMAGRAILATTLVSGSHLMRYMAQATGIDAAMHDFRRNGLGASRNEGLIRIRCSTTMTTWAPCREFVASLTQLLKLVARQAGHVGHSTFVDSSLGMAIATGRRAEACVMTFENVALIAA